MNCYKTASLSNMDWQPEMGPFKRMAAHRPMFCQGIKGTDTACQSHLSRKQQRSLQADVYSKVAFLGQDSIFGRDDSIFPSHLVTCWSRTRMGGWIYPTCLSAPSHESLASEGSWTTLWHTCFKQKACGVLGLQIIINFSLINKKTKKCFIWTQFIIHQSGF